MTAPVPQAAFRAGTDEDRTLKAHYARVYNFPNKLQNLCDKIEALRDEARELGFTAEAAHLSAMAVFANCLPDRDTRQKVWTSSEVTQLKTMWLAGAPLKVIADKIGRTAPATYAAVKRNNLPRRKQRRAV